MKSVIVLIPYFGQWPEWFGVFLLSCSHNPTINWCFYTDCPVPAAVPPNVRLVSMSFADYCRLVNERVGIRFEPHMAYRLCDVRPMFGEIHAEDIAGFDVYGYGDIDVVYGNIRHFYTDDVLSHDYISTHQYIASGHLSLFRNTPRMHRAFRQIPDWQRKIETPGRIEWKDNLNEAGLSQLFHPRFLGQPPQLDHYRENNYFHEQYTTPFKPEPWLGGASRHPEVWHWEDGRLTNEVDGGREFLYLHFMNFRYARYVAPEYAEAPWEKLERLVHFDAAMEPPPRRIRIDRLGFHAALPQYPRGPGETK